MKFSLWGNIITSGQTISFWLAVDRQVAYTKPVLRLRMMGHQQNIVYCFGAYRVDALKRQLSTNGRLVSVTAKAFDTLLMLIRRPGEVVTKDELIHNLWPNTIVEENNLLQQVSALRKALGERAGEQKFIATIPGRGYCFVASVEEVSMARREQPKTLFRSPIFEPGTLTGASLAVGMIMLIALGFLWSYTQNPWHSGRPQSLAVLQFRAATAEDAFLGSGISDTLRARLGSVQDLTLRAGGPSLGDRDALAAGREMHVDTVVTGSVQRDRERVRVAVELLDVADGRIMWGKTFDDNFSNIFELQDSIAGEVARVLRVKFSSGDYKSFRRLSGLAINGLLCEIQRVTIAGRKELEFSA